MATGDKRFMVTKGALRNILEACSSAEAPNGKVVEIASVQEQIRKHFEDFSGKGFRTLGIAYRDLGSESTITPDQEVGHDLHGIPGSLRPTEAGHSENHRASQAPWCFFEDYHWR